MKKTGLLNFKNKLHFIFLGIVVVVLLSAVFRYRSGEIDYLNSDATWHTLLTIEAYDETPVSEHLFLPIVSLGKESDKGIPWGATVPDKKGNYFYTSFSPAGYALPWLFFKIFHLPVNETSLYCFNTVLFCVSSLIWIWLLSIVYKDDKHKEILCFIGGFSYALAPELLHGMGIVYWHQSIMQVTLLLQIVMYYKYAVLGDKKCKWIFYILSLINPCIEWTGYVANVGFAAAELICNRKKGIKLIFIKTASLGALTAASFLCFSFHYLLRIDKAVYIAALKDRFTARNISTDAALTDMFGGYFKSFLYLWIILLIFAVWCFIRNKKLELSNGILILVMSFPVLENVIMKQHAIAYTYDRMKAAFVIIFIMCELARNILDNKKRQIDGVIIIEITAFLSVINILTYSFDPSYIREVNYRSDNEALASAVTEKYPDALYASGTEIRGYMNLLFERGIFENVLPERAAELAAERQKDHVVYITKDGYQVTDIVVYDIDTGEEVIYTVKNKVISENRYGGNHKEEDNTEKVTAK